MFLYIDSHLYFGILRECLTFEVIFGYYLLLIYKYLGNQET